MRRRGRLRSKIVKQKRNNEEHKIQCAIIDWARLAERSYPGLELLHAIPNGGARDVVTGAMLKREGVLRGVPDLFLPVPYSSGYSGLYIEVKTPRGKLTNEQTAFMGKARAQGYATRVVRSAQDGIDCIAEYLCCEFVQK